MIRIRPEQVDSLARAADVEFNERLAAYLDEHFVARAELGPEPLMRFVRAQRQRAESYGFADEQQVATFVVCAWALGADFDKKDAQVLAVLSSPLNSADRKADWLTRFAERQSARDGEAEQ